MTGKGFSVYLYVVSKIILDHLAVKAAKVLKSPTFLKALWLMEKLLEHTIP